MPLIFHRVLGYMLLTYIYIFLSSQKGLHRPKKRRNIFFLPFLSFFIYSRLFLMKNIPYCVARFSFVLFLPFLFFFLFFCATICAYASLRSDKKKKRKTFVSTFQYFSFLALFKRTCGQIDKLSLGTRPTQKQTRANKVDVQIINYLLKVTSFTVNFSSK